MDKKIDRIVPAEDTVMQLRPRIPYYWDEAGLLVVVAESLEWDDFPFEEPIDCDHYHSACNNCLGDWFADYTIRLTDVTNADLTVNLDDVWEQQQIAQGVRPIHLAEFAHSLDSPGSK